MKNISLLVVASLMLMGFASVASATHDLYDAGDERETNYIGSTTAMHLLNEQCAEELEEPECPVRIHRGIFFGSCDYLGNGLALTLGMYHNVGGASFCQIQKSINNESVQHDQFARIKYDDISLFDPAGMVTCPETVADPTGTSNWNREFSQIDANDVWITVQVPEWCDAAGGHEHRTNVNIFNMAADIREGVTIGGAFEGQAFLEVLNPLPGE